MSTKVQLSGGAFQDATGNLLANGYLLLVLSQDGQVNSTTQIAAGIEIKILLDGSGNVSTSPAQFVWPNDVITPTGTFYNVSAYTASGQLVWGPNAQQVLSTPSPFILGAWVPNQANLAAGNAVTYDIGVFVPGLYIASQIILLLALERAVRFEVGLVPSTAACGTNPTTGAVFSLKKNGTQFATLTVNTDGSTSYSAASGVIFNAGDVLSIVAPSSPDASLANLGILLSGTVVGI